MVVRMRSVAHQYSGAPSSTRPGAMKGWCDCEIWSPLLSISNGKRWWSFVITTRQTPVGRDGSREACMYYAVVGLVTDEGCSTLTIRAQWETALACSCWGPAERKHSD